MQNENNLTTLGTYVGIRVHKDSRDQIMDFCEKNNIQIQKQASIYDRRMHCTIFYCKQPVEVIPLVDKIFIAYPEKWIILKSETTRKDCLALQLVCNELKDYHNELKSITNLTHHFGDYTLHISLDFEHDGQIPAKLPEFYIKLVGFYTKPLYFDGNVPHNFD